MPGCLVGGISPCIIAIVLVALMLIPYAAMIHAVHGEAAPVRIETRDFYDKVSTLVLQEDYFRSYSISPDRKLLAVYKLERNILSTVKVYKLPEGELLASFNWGDLAKANKVKFTPFKPDSIYILGDHRLLLHGEFGFNYTSKYRILFIDPYTLEITGHVNYTYVDFTSREEGIYHRFVSFNPVELVDYYLVFGNITPRLVAVALESGEVIWEAELPGSPARDAPFYEVSWSPDWRLMAFVLGYPGEQRFYLTLLDVDGRILWSREFTNTFKPLDRGFNWVAWSSDSNIVFFLKRVKTGGNMHTIVMALNAANGETIWEVELKQRVRSVASYGGKVVILGDGPARIHKLDNGEFVGIFYTKPSDYPRNAAMTDPNTLVFTLERVLAVNRIPSIGVVDILYTDGPGELELCLKAPEPVKVDWSSWPVDELCLVPEITPWNLIVRAEPGEYNLTVGGLELLWAIKDNDNTIPGIGQVVITDLARRYLDRIDVLVVARITVEDLGYTALNFTFKDIVLGHLAILEIHGPEDTTIKLRSSMGILSEDITASGVLRLLLPPGDYRVEYVPVGDARYMHLADLTLEQGSYVVLEVPGGEATGGEQGETGGQPADVMEEQVAGEEQAGQAVQEEPEQAAQQVQEEAGDGGEGNTLVMAGAGVALLLLLALLVLGRR